jgi:hypothetical protein
MSFKSMNEYTTIVDGSVISFKKERNESQSQFLLRLEIYIKALELGYDQGKALMLSSMSCNKVKYGVSYKNT